MPKKAKALGAKAVKEKVEPGLHAVGTVAGLHLQVLASGARTWILRATVGAKRRDMGLGGYPDVTLAEAVEKARAARALIEQGVDPIEQRRATKSALLAEQGRSISFREAAERYISAHQAGWKNAKHAQQWSNTLEAYAFPTLGGLMVGDVTVSHVIGILEPIWAEKTETASRVRNRIELVLDWAAARGYRTGVNPARWRGHLDKLLPKPSKVARRDHFAAVPLNEAASTLAQIRAVQGMGARALEFAILTAARSGEVRGATWGEFDIPGACWTIPGERMKAGREHRIPLSAAALAILSALPAGQADEVVFPGARSGRPLSDMSLSAVMRRIGSKAVPHGFRSTFRDWASERTAYPQEVAEMALAHTISNKAEAAYRRGDLFEKRRQMMAAWAEFLADTTLGRSSAVPIRRRMSAGIQP